MDFKEKYEMALEGIQEILSSGSDSIKMSRLRLRLQGFFPELKESESEDERIRKWLIAQLKVKSDGTNSDLDLMIEKAIAWLENQKEFVSANFEDVWETADCEKLTAPLEKYEMETIKKLCHAWYDKGIELERKKGIETQVKKEHVLKSTKHEDVCKFKEYLERRAEVYELNLPNRSYDIYAFAKELLAWFEKHGNTDIEQVFRPLAGCDIDTAAKQAVEQQKQGKNVVLAFNGCYIPVENNTADAIVEEYEAWFKQQSDIASYESAEKEKQEFVDAGFIKCYADFQDFKEGETYWLEYLGNDNYNVRSDNLLGKTYHITPCQLYTIFKKQPWSEAQDELVPNPYSGVSFNDNGNVWGMCARDNGVDILFNKKLIQHISAEIQRDKIEPKFKEGDKVLADGKVYTIKRVNESTYIVDENGRDVQEHFSRTKGWKLYEQNSWKPSLEEMDTLYGLAYITHVIDDKKDVVLTRLYQDLKREFFGGASYENMFPSSHIDDEKQNGQKPVYTPSFNVDDFIANEYCTGKVVELTNDAYLLDTGQCIPFSCHSTHLWSIKDAKDGDVLVNWNNTVFIFKAIEDDTVKFYIAYNEKWDAIKTPSTKLSHLGLPEHQFEFHPATKEQCDTLMNAMADAGYEWNVEKKKLQKIEKKQGNKIEPKFKVKYNGNEYNVLDIRSSAGIIFYGIEDEPNHIDYVQAQNCEEVDGYTRKENGSPYPTKSVVFSEQTPAYEVESKFHEGDWVVQDHTILKIKSVRSPHYCFETVGGYVDNMLISEIDSQFHLWSVEDAKDGDVLAFDDDTIVIFKNLYNKTSFHSYCHIDEGIFETSKDDNPDWWDAAGFYPATKEQRNLLYLKMAEAGYEWEEANKKQKKIEMKELVEQKHNCSEEALQYLREHHSPSEISDFQAAMNIAVANAYDKGKADAINTMKTEWGEEDEKCYNSIIEHLKYSITNGKPETYKGGRLTDWLKSIKDKYISEQ